MTMDVSQLGTFYLDDRPHSAVMLVSDEDWREVRKVLEA